MGGATSNRIASEERRSARLAGHGNRMVGGQHSAVHRVARGRKASGKESMESITQEMGIQWNLNRAKVVLFLEEEESECPRIRP